MLSKLKRGWVLLANFSIFLTFLVILKRVIKELLWFTHLFYINQFFFNITNCKNWAKLRIWNFNDQGRKWYFCLSIFYIICTSFLSFSSFLSFDESFFSQLMLHFFACFFIVSQTVKMLLGEELILFNLCLYACCHLVLSQWFCICICICLYNWNRKSHTFLKEGVVPQAVWSTVWT